MPILQVPCGFHASLSSCRSGSGVPPACPPGATWSSEITHTGLCHSCPLLFPLPDAQGHPISLLDPLCLMQIGERVKEGSEEIPPTCALEGTLPSGQFQIKTPVGCPQLAQTCSVPLFQRPATPAGTATNAGTRETSRLSGRVQECSIDPEREGKGAGQVFSTSSL